MNFRFAVVSHWMACKIRHAYLIFNTKQSVDPLPLRPVMSTFMALMLLAVIGKVF